MTSRPPVLFVSHQKRRCGVHQFGENVAAALATSRRYHFVYAECDGPEALLRAARRVDPVAVIYNYYPSTLPWLRRRHLRELGVPQLGLVHEVTQSVADAATDWFFDARIAPDPTLLLRNPLVFKTGRLVPAYRTTRPAPEVTTIGSFGFGLGGKGFERLIDLVQEQLDEAVIRLHIPYADFGDRDGAQARAIAAACRSRLRKPGVRLELTHDFLSQEALLEFLAGNSLNAFLYEEQRGRGIASVTDFALAVDRPLAITKSTMFRHLLGLRPSICVEDVDLPTLLHRGTAATRRLAAGWTAENLAWDYERIVDAALARGRRTLGQRLRGQVDRVLGRATGRQAGRDWVPDAAAGGVAGAEGAGPPYDSSLVRPEGFNRILDRGAAVTYRPALDFLERRFPALLSRKLARANVQQAFVLDTVARLAPPRERARLLCVGAFEDTASAALRACGYQVDEVDPVLNYDLATFLTRPDCPLGGYDVVFSTSVIEHVADDARFVADVGRLLAPGGLAVLTADFDDAWAPGRPLPREDHRLYTARDFEARLLPLVPSAHLVDAPRWLGVAPDFDYGGCRYAFATLVFRKEA